jgi:hypothetical protein
MPRWLPLLLASSACAGALALEDLRLSSAGLGAAQFGMTLQQVEQALGSRLTVTDRQRRHWQSAVCSVHLKDRPGTQLVFDKGRFAATVLAAPSTIATRSGISIGDPERKAIDTLGKDPTYHRSENRYSDGKGATMEIFVGKVATDARTQELRGTLVRLTSVRGKVQQIEAGLASFVSMDEHEGDEC